MNFKLWEKALQTIPNVSKEDWNDLDPISRWLISTRAAVLVMTIISATLAGLFAIRNGSFQLLPWLALTFGLVMAHASNNLLNDLTDFIRGVDQKDYYRTLYGTQPLVDGLMTRGQSLTYFGISAVLALASGLYLIWQNNNDSFIWVLIGLGAFFLLFYTWPIKYLALGEVSVFIVWGPLMIGGGYYVIAHQWDWNVVWATLPYALGVTTVIFGKHIDKIAGDRERNIRTLPVLIGERAARYLVIGMMVLPYFLLAGLVATRYFTPFILIVVFALPRLRSVLPAFLKPKPSTRPDDFPEGQGGWPLYFAPLTFLYNRTFGTFFIIGMIGEILLRLFLPAFWI